jgi:tRNA G18 (ribose-2'-O)-methylase SpoU
LNIRSISSLTDPLVEPYRYMKDKELARAGSRFIAEGENVVRRLLASGMSVESVLIAHRKQKAIALLVPHNVPLLIGSDELIEQIIGFEFHSGVLACGIRPPSPSLDAILPPSPRRAVVTICQQITNTENLGSLIRISAALGADAMILGEHCCDPFFRQSIRVSMGTIFSLPIVRSADLLMDLDCLAEDWQFQRIAAVSAPDAQPLQSVKPPPRVAVVFGNEAQGLDPATIAHCDLRVIIPMWRNTDSLNVAVAAAIFLYHLNPARER